MIIDSLSNAPIYYGIDEGITSALQFLAANKDSLKDMDLGSTSLSDAVNIKITEYETVKEGKWESHRKHVDIHYMISGKEMVGYSNINFMQQVNINEEKDQILYSGQGEQLLLNEGFFMIVFPEDVHAARIAYNNCIKVRKAMIKVKYHILSCE